MRKQSVLWSDKCLCIFDMDVFTERFTAGSRSLISLCKDGASVTADLMEMLRLAVFQINAYLRNFLWIFLHLHGSSDTALTSEEPLKLYSSFRLEEHQALMGYLWTFSRPSGECVSESVQHSTGRFRRQGSSKELRVCCSFSPAKETRPLKPVSLLCSDFVLQFGVQVSWALDRDR